MIPTVVPAMLLGIWAISSMIFSIMYRFRRRWAATLDGYSMFRFGADFGQMVEKNKRFGSTEDYETCGALRKIPGLVGDTRPKFAPGLMSRWRRVSQQRRIKYTDRGFMRLYQQQVRRENIRGDSSFGINHIWSLGSLIYIPIRTSKASALKAKYGVDTQSFVRTDPILSRISFLLLWMLL